MKTPILALAGFAVVSTSALGQVRPEDCRPVFPVVDQVAEAVIPQDVMTPRAGPVTTAAKRRFAGVPFLPLLLGAGGLAVLVGSSGGDGGDHFVSPA